jgi:hypothetical protein
MSVGALTRFDQADSGRLAKHADPLRLLQRNGIAVYIKINRTLYFARTQAMAFVMFVSNGWLLSDNETDSTRGLAFDNDVLYLKLDDEHLSEIRQSGDCHISVFKSGGLKRGMAVDPKQARSRAVDAGPLEFVTFGECSLIDKKCLEKARGVANPPWQLLMNADPCVAQLKVCIEDLYIATSDAQAMKKEGSLDWDCFEYPLKGRDGYAVPIPIYWLYQVSHALKQMPTSKPSDVAPWLKKFAPKEAHAMRSIKTIAALAHPKYKKRKRFDGVDLADFKPAESLPAELLTKQVRLLMAITDWWLNTRESWQRDWQARPKEARGYLWEPLAHELKAARFEKTATRELTAVISNLSVTDVAWKEVLPKLGTWENYRVGDDP